MVLIRVERVLKRKYECEASFYVLIKKMLTEDRITQELDSTLLSSAKIGWTHLLVKGLQFHSPLLYMSVNNGEKNPGIILESEEKWNGSIYEHVFQNW